MPNYTTHLYNQPITRASHILVYLATIGWVFRVFGMIEDLLNGTLNDLIAVLMARRRSVNINRRATGDATFN